MKLMNMKLMNKCLAGLMALLLLAGLSVPALAAEEAAETVTIASAEDLAELARRCTLDVWSQGKTVTLTADIDLSGTAFTAIPTFGGVFEGQGHTISGLSLTQGGGTQGLFRYIQESGVVKDLTVQGQVAPSELKTVLGGIVGENHGLVQRCTFRGTVEGTTAVGGIAGRNEAAGRLINCVSTARLTGEHSVGGVVGENYGSVISCENRGRVNTTEVEDETDLTTMDVTDLRSTENLPASTDIGGVAGFSTGILQSCKNSGPVGYAHVGYNVGGIVGRQSGYLDGCINTGAVLGRKDVGGVAGQLEPKLTLRYEQSLLDQLWDEMDTLQDLLDSALDHTSASSDSISAQLDRLGDSGRTVKDATKDLSDAMTDWANSGIDSFNDLSARLSWTLDQMEPITDDLTDIMDQMEGVSGRLGDVLEDAEDLSDDAQAAVSDLRRGIRALEDGAAQGRRDLAALRAAAGELRDSLGDGEATAQAVQALLSSLTDLGDGLLDALQTAAGDLEQGMDRLENAGGHADDVLDGLQGVSRDMEDIAGQLTDAMDDTHAVIQDLADRPTIEMERIGSDITDRGDALDDAMSALLDEADGLNDVISDGSDTLIADLRAVNQQLRAITDLIHRIVDNARDKEVEDAFEDVSDQSQTEEETAGRISACRSSGTVEGDVNTGGIVGAMAVEYDFDPEDDLTESGDRSADFTYQALARVTDCVNRGTVTGKKDSVGGIVGLMDLGLVARCQGLGTVESTDGDYVGGIAGTSSATIRDCWAVCVLSGNFYVGGIAGSGSTITGCHSLIEIAEGGACLGAIAGKADTDDEDADVTGNTFVHETLGGIDGVSYAGVAEPEDYEALAALPDAPAAFTKLSLTFVADGQTVAEVPFQYGQGINSLPEVPAKAGCAGNWPELDYDHLTFPYTLEAAYRLYDSALAEGGEVPEVLVDGSFSADAAISYTVEDAEWREADGTLHTGTAYTVTVEDPAAEQAACTVHIRLPDPDGQYLLWVREGESWKAAAFTVDGSYLLYESGSGQVTLFLERSFSQARLLAAILAALAAAILLAVFLIHRRRTRKAGGVSAEKTSEKGEPRPEPETGPESGADRDAADGGTGPA